MTSSSSSSPPTTTTTLQQALLAAEELARRRKLEADALQGEVEELSRKFEASRARIRELEEIAARAEAANVPHQLEIKRLRHDAEVAQEHAKWVEKNFHKLTAESNEARSLHAAELAKCEERVRLEREKNVRIPELELKVTLLQKQVREAAEEANDVKATAASLERELNTSKRLAEVWKQEKEATEHEKDAAMELATRQGEMNEAFKKQAEEQREASASEIAKLKAEIEELKKHASVVAVHENLSARATEEQLRARGMTATVLYASLAHESELRKRAEGEREAIAIQFSHIVRELEAKAPMLAAMRRECEAALTVHDELVEKLAGANGEIRRLTREVEERDKRLEAAKEETARTKQNVADLSSQIQHLISASSGASVVVGEHHRGDDEDAEIQSPSRMNASDIITERLVTFSNVKELQERNRQLLRVVRKLTADREAEEARAASTEELTKALKDVEELRGARKRQEDMMKVIVTQRETYRIQALQAEKELEKLRGGSSGQPRLEAAPPASGTTNLDNNVSESKFHRDYQKQLEEWRAENERVKRENLDLRLAANRLETDLGFHRRRNEELEAMHAQMSQDLARTRALADSLRNDLGEMRDAATERARGLAAAEAELKRLESELSRAREAKALVVGEIDQLKAHVDSVVQQREALRRSADELSASLAVATRERERSEARATEAEAREREARGEIDAATGRVSAERDALRLRVEDAVREAGELRERLARAEAELEAFKRTEALLRDQLDHSNRVAASKFPAAAAASSSTGTGGNISSMGSGGEREEELALLRSETKSLREQLELKSSDAVAYKNIAASNEEAIKKLSEATERWKAESEENLRTCMDERNNMAKDLERLKGEREVETREAEERARRLGVVEAQLRDAEKRLAEALKNNETLSADVARHAATARAASENYERELQLHAGDTVAMRALRDRADAAEASVLALERERDALRGEVEAARRSGEEALVTLKRRVAEYEERILPDLRRENDLLTSQIASYASSASISSANLSGNEQAMRLSELVEVTKKQRDRFLLEKEELALETARLNQQIVLLKRDLERSANPLPSSPVASSTSSTSSPSAAAAAGPLSEASHAKMMAAIRENQVLRNMNAYMTEETRTLRELTTQLENEARAARADAVAAAKTAENSEKETRTLREELDSRLRENTLLQRSYQEMVERLGDAGLKEDLKRARAELETSKLELESAKAQVATLTETVNRLQAERDAAVKEKEDTAARAKRMAEASMQRSRDANESLTKKTEEISAMKTRVEELDKELAEAKSKAEQAVKDMESAKEMVDKRGQMLERYRSKANEDKSKRDELEGQLKDAQAEIARLTAAQPASSEQPAAAIATSPDTIPVDVLTTFLEGLLPRHLRKFAKILGLDFQGKRVDVIARVREEIKRMVFAPAASAGEEEGAWKAKLRTALTSAFQDDVPAGASSSSQSPQQARTTQPPSSESTEKPAGEETAPPTSVFGGGIAPFGGGEMSASGFGGAAFGSGVVDSSSAFGLTTTSTTTTTTAPPSAKKAKSTATSLSSRAKPFVPATAGIASGEAEPTTAPTTESTTTTTTTTTTTAPTTKKSDKKEQIRALLEAKKAAAQQQSLQSGAFPATAAKSEEGEASTTSRPASSSLFVLAPASVPATTTTTIVPSATSASTTSDVAKPPSDADMEVIKARRAARFGIPSALVPSTSTVGPTTGVKRTREEEGEEGSDSSSKKEMRKEEGGEDSEKKSSSE